MDDAERAKRLFDAWYDAKHAQEEQRLQQMYGYGLYYVYQPGAPFAPSTPTVFTTDLPAVKRETDEPLIAPEVAAYLAEWFSR